MGQGMLIHAPPTNVVVRNGTPAQNGHCLHIIYQKQQYLFTMGCILLCPSIHERVFDLVEVSTNRIHHFGWNGITYFYNCNCFLCFNN